MLYFSFGISNQEIVILKTYFLTFTSKNKGNLLELKIPRAHHRLTPLEPSAISFWRKRPVTKIIINAVAAFVRSFRFV